MTSFALTTAPASHGAVVIAVLPAATAVVAVPQRPALVRPAAVRCGAGRGGRLRGGRAARPRTGRLADRVVGARAGRAADDRPYAAGSLLAVAQHPPSGTAVEWAAFAYLAVVSMYLGFFAWYRGLAIGPMAQVSQVQLSQPVMNICWAALLLGEDLSWPTVLGGVVVIGCAATAVRARASGAPLR
ncbi:DMT family transporter [Saccharopolyspora sp. NPDC000359]|uniref:DMT family transporter n=1 Tax=Saccharopolyspora sp. NPDC000359 TaxID=3154251 RepID=UPI00331C2798